MKRRGLLTKLFLGIAALPEIAKASIDSDGNSEQLSEQLTDKRQPFYPDSVAQKIYNNSLRRFMKNATLRK